MSFKKIKVALVGYGNVGSYALNTIKNEDDMELCGVVYRNKNNIPNEIKNEKIVSDVQDIEELGEVDVAILCIPTRSVEENAKILLAKGINTVDSFDIHGAIYNLKKSLGEVAEKHNSVAIISAGWDPGSDSVVRALFKTAVPKGITYTNFGPGMSMGHSVVAKSKKGVENALSMTIPLGTGVHRRVVYIQMKDGYNFEESCKEIKKDNYFANDETVFIEVKNINEVIDMGHGVNILRKGVSGTTHNQLLELNMKINNPALTAQIMVSYARATTKMKSGCYTTIEVPVIKTLKGTEEEIIRELV